MGRPTVDRYPEMKDKIQKYLRLGYGQFSVSAAQLQKEFGRNSTKWFNQTVQELNLQMVSNYSAGNHTRVWGGQIPKLEESEVRLDLRTPEIEWIYESYLQTNLDPNAFAVSAANPNEHRIYYTFSYINKDIRKTATMNNIPLVEIDIRNCQPTILLYLAKKDMVFVPEIAYTKATSGEFYDWVAEQVGNVTRDQVKGIVVRLFNSPRKTVQFPYELHEPALRVTRWFISELPEFYRWVRTIASQKGKIHRIATLVEGRIREQVVLKCKEQGIHILPIHDAFCVKMDDAVKTVRIISDVVNNNTFNDIFPLDWFPQAPIFTVRCMIEGTTKMFTTNK